MSYEKIFNTTKNELVSGENFLVAMDISNKRVLIPATVRNHLLVGQPGYGKTVFTCKLVDCLLKDEPNTYCVFFQTKPDDFTGKFLNKGDKVISVSSKVPYGQEQIFYWNLMNEIYESEDSISEAEELSTMFFQDLLQDSRNIVWAEAAKDLFKGYILTVLHLKLRISNKELLCGMLDTDYSRLFRFLSIYPPNISMLKNNFGFELESSNTYKITKKGSDIIFFYHNVLSKWQGNFLNDKGTDTVQSYLAGRYGKNLFFLFDFKYKNASKPFFCYFLKKLITERLSMTGNNKHPIIFVLDEIDKLGGGSDIGVLEAVNLGRDYKIQVILSTQSVESLYLLAPEKQAEHITHATHAGFSALIAFHLGDVESKNLFKQLFGEIKKTTVTLPTSRYERLIEKTDIEYIVSDEALSNLKVGEFFIKIGDSFPCRLKLNV